MTAFNNRPVKEHLIRGAIGYVKAREASLDPAKQDLYMLGIT